MGLGGNAQPHLAMRDKAQPRRTGGTDVPLTWAVGGAEPPAGLYTVQGTTEYLHFTAN
jgi:hypothetical protein